MKFANKVTSNKDLAKTCDPEIWAKWQTLVKSSDALDPNNPSHMNVLRFSLLDFIADFSNWDNSTKKEYLETSRQLTQVAHEALGGGQGTRPLVVDPFAGGGSIPLEALRVGGDTFASDLNPVAVLLNKVVLEYIPKYGKRLADDLNKWGAWISQEANNQLGEFYPQSSKGIVPLAYIWARTIRCEGPKCGAKVPLMRSFWLARKGSNSVAIRLVPDVANRQISFEIVKNIRTQNIGEGTIRRGSATCPICGYTTPLAKVKEQFRNGDVSETLICVIDVPISGKSKSYRLPTQRDMTAVHAATEQLHKRVEQYSGGMSLYPTEDTTKYHTFVNRGSIYGLTSWDKYYTTRQLLSLVVYCDLIRQACEQLTSKKDTEYVSAFRVCLSLQASRLADFNSSLCALNTTGGRGVVHTFGRQALPMVWDFAETNPLNTIGANWDAGIKAITKFTRDNQEAFNLSGKVEQCDAARHILADDIADAFITDPPYYYAIQYADLSDFFYVWLRRLLRDYQPDLFSSVETPKENEIIIQSPGDIDKPDGKNRKHYESKLRDALKEGRRILHPDGIGTVVFAHKTTEGWESLLQSLVSAGWIVTASWPIDTERPGLGTPGNCERQQ